MARILFHHRIASSDGQFVHLSELTKALRAEGHEVRVVGPAIQEGDHLGQTNRLVATLKGLLPKALYEVIECLYSLIATFRLLRHARDFQPDALYERYNLHLHAGRFVAGWLKIPYLLEINAPLTQERARYSGLALPAFAHWSDRIIWNSADVCLPVSNVLADYQRRAGVPEERICVVHNGADLALYPLNADRAAAKAALGIAQDRIVFGFVGFIHAWHGLPKVLDYLHEHREFPIHVHVVGDGGADKRALEEQAERLGIADRLTITGFIDRETVPHHIRAFDIALQPASTAYASPLKLFEYLAAGCATVAPATANIKEILTDQVDALLFDPDDKGAMVSCLNRLCGDQALRQQLGRHARRLVESHPYTWQANARLVAGWIEKLKARKT